MNRKAALCVVIFAVAVGLAVSLPALADDGAASIAAGGLVPRRETRIVMAKEVLRISEKKIVVDYDFRNDTSEDVTTEVAFPVPPYEYMDGEANPAGQNFASFKVWVNDIPIQYRIEAKATVGRMDVTDIWRPIISTSRHLATLMRHPRIFPGYLQMRKNGSQGMASAIRTAGLFYGSYICNIIGRRNFRPIPQFTSDMNIGQLLECLRRS
jgi:hypothetical protein